MGERTTFALLAVGWHCSTNTGTMNTISLSREQASLLVLALEKLPKSVTKAWEESKQQALYELYETLHLFQKLCLHKEQCLLLKRSSKSNFGTTVGNCLLDDILGCAYRTVSTQQDRFERSK